MNVIVSNKNEGLLNSLDVDVIKSINGEYEADFISCVAWRERAELINKHFGKGSQIGIEGHIQTGS